MLCEVRMSVNLDFRDRFHELNVVEARYLVVGAYAVIHHTEPRFTKDLDIWVEPTVTNAARVWQALTEFGAPLDNVTPRDLSDRSLVYQIGIAPNRIDIIMDVAGAKFATAWQNRVPSEYGDEPINIMGLDDLIRAKRAAGRARDKLDLRRLEATKRRLRKGNNSRRAD